MILYGVETWTDLDDVGVSIVERRLHASREAAEKRVDAIERGHDDDSFRCYAKVIEFEVEK